MPCFKTLALATGAVFGLCCSAYADIAVCNDFRARVRVALAYEDQGSFVSGGWWSVAPGACQDVDFPFQGARLYYTATSDSYKQGRSTMHDHWGNKTQLYVASKDFRFDNADQRRRGAKPDMFSMVELSEQQLLKHVTITLRFSDGTTTTQIKTE